MEVKKAPITANGLGRSTKTAQRDADHTYYAPEIEKRDKRIAELQEVCKDWERLIEQASIAERKRIYEWGDDKCPHRQYGHRRGCDTCWQELLKSLEVKP